MKINNKVLQKLNEKVKSDEQLKIASRALLVLESEGIGNFKEAYKKIIEDSVIDNDKKLILGCD